MSSGTCTIPPPEKFDPNRFVLLDDLYVPKTLVSPQKLKGTLDIFLPDSRKTLRLWKDHPYHTQVPRHFIPLSEIPTEKMLDLRPPFPRIPFRSRIRWRDGVQIEAYSSLQKSEGGILHLSCGKGKTVISLGLVAHRAHPTVVIVHTKDLMQQWIERIEEMLIFPGGIGIVKGDRAEWDRNIVIASISTLYRRKDEVDRNMLMKFGTVIYDEVHHLSAPEFLSTANMFVGDRWGLTATVRREDGLEHIYQWHVGNVLYSHTDPELVPRIYFARTGVVVPRKQVLSNGQVHLSLLQKWLALNSARNQQIADLVKEALKNKRRVLVLGHIKEQLGLLKDLVGKGEVCHGEVKDAERTRVLKEANPIFATIQLAKEGLDQPSIDTVIFTTPFKSYVFLVQGMGRSQRKREGKKRPVIVFLDDASKETQKYTKKLRELLSGYGYEFTNT